MVVSLGLSKYVTYPAHLILDFIILISGRVFLAFKVTRKCQVTSFSLMNQKIPLPT